MDQLRPDAVASGVQALEREALQGRNTLVYSRSDQLTKLAVDRALAITSGDRVQAGTRITIVVKGSLRAGLEESGFAHVREVGTKLGKRHALSVGTRRWCADEQRMDHELLRAHMDPKDVGLEEDDMDLKRAMVWSEIGHDPEDWKGKDLPQLVEDLMTGGAVVPPPPGPPAYAEIQQYAWDTPEALAAGITEADRALAVGFME